MLSPFLILFSNLFLFSPPPSYDLRLQFSLQFPPKASLLTTTSFLSPLLLKGGASCVLFLGSWVSSSTINGSQNFSGVSGGLKSPQWREHLFWCINIWSLVHPSSNLDWKYSWHSLQSKPNSFFRSSFLRTVGPMWAKVGTAGSLFSTSSLSSNSISSSTRVLTVFRTLCFKPPILTWKIQRKMLFMSTSTAPYKLKKTFFQIGTLKYETGTQKVKRSLK